LSHSTPIFSPRISTIKNIAALRICGCALFTERWSRLIYVPKPASSTHPAVGPGSLTGSTIWWKQVRFVDVGPGNLINHVTLLATEAEGSNVALRERLEKLSAFQLQMLRHAMKCTPTPTCRLPFTVLLPCLVAICDFRPPADERLAM
jgi:hypothetical protein